MKELYQKTQDAKACGDDMPQCLEKTLLLGIVRYGKTLSALQTVRFNPLNSVYSVVHIIISIVFFIRQSCSFRSVYLF